MVQQSLNENSVKRMAVDAGALYVNYGEDDERLVGATRGGNSFNIEQTVRQIEVDNARGPLVGGRRVVSETARITANIMEMTRENIQFAIFGSSLNTDEVSRTLSIPGASAYLTNVALVGTMAGSSDPIVCKLKNAIADGNFELTMEDQNEAAVEVQLTAHFLPEALNDSPWSILVPEIPAP